jgi:hypothetical protein
METNALQQAAWRKRKIVRISTFAIGDFRGSATEFVNADDDLKDHREEQVNACKRASAISDRTGQTYVPPPEPLASAAHTVATSMQRGS